jgi:8-oxo-dGTP pyrophosphatase MutT (NUDIX family)
MDAPRSCEPPRVRCAASVVLVRPSSNDNDSNMAARESPFEVLLVRRSARARFLPGVHVFPGGCVERSDETWADDVRLRPAAKQRHQQKTELREARNAAGESEVIGAWDLESDALDSVNECFDNSLCTVSEPHRVYRFDEEDGAEVGAAPVCRPGISRLVAVEALRCAAVRELFEETGVLLATRGVGEIEARLSQRSGEGSTAADPARCPLREEREKVDADTEHFTRFLSSVQAEPETSSLFPFGWLVTPRPNRWRYNTLFFLAIEWPETDRGHADHDPKETQGLVWITPEDALRAYGEDRLPLVLPTWAHLRRLAAFRTLGQLEDFARTQKFTGPGFPASMLSASM